MDRAAACSIARASKKNFNNQWTNFDWASIPFEQLHFNRKRQRVLKDAGFACEMCSFAKTRPDGKCIIQVDHIDGNKDNCKRSNLRALCPNCHAVHSEHFMFYGRKHSGDKTRFVTNGKPRCGVMDNTQASEA